jgi:hypothetical protein
MSLSKGGGWEIFWNLASGQRYSIGETLGGTFFVLRLDDSDRSVRLEWFSDLESVRQSDLPEELKQAAGRDRGAGE